MLNKLLACLIIAASSPLAVNAIAIAATDKTDEPTTATHHDKKAKKSTDHKSSTHSNKKSTHKSDAKPAKAKPAEATK